MHDKRTPESGSTAALWRAVHVQANPSPHVLEAEIDLKLVAPDAGWRLRRDMDRHATSLFRAPIVASARFIEDRVVEEAGHGARK